MASDGGAVMNSILRRGRPSSQEQEREQVSPEEMAGVVSALKNHVDSMAEQQQALLDQLESHEAMIQALEEAVSAIGASKSQSSKPAAQQSAAPKQ